MIRVLAVAATLGLSVTSAGFAQCTDAERAALETLDKAWGEAGVRGDRAYLQNLYADNYMTLNPVGTVDKTTMLANTMRDAEANRANPLPTVVPDHYVISCTPNTATITHRNTIPAPEGSMSGPTYSRSIHMLEKRGNTWQVVSSTGYPLTDQAQLVYLEQDWNDAMKRRDTAWIERNYASFASDIGSRTGALENKTQAMASLKADKIVNESLDLSELNVRVEGDVGLVTGVNHIKGRDAQGKAFDRRVRFTDTFIRRDGRWQVWATQGTVIQ
jgi:ketosteroid isomerase-like protein